MTAFSLASFSTVVLIFYLSYAYASGKKEYGSLDALSGLQTPAWNEEKRRVCFFLLVTLRKQGIPPATPT